MTAPALNEADTPAIWEQWNLPASLQRGIPPQLLILHVLMLNFIKTITHKGLLTVSQGAEDSTKRTGYKQMLVEGFEAHK